VIPLILTHTAHWRRPHVSGTAALTLAALPPLSACSHHASAPPPPPLVVALPVHPQDGGGPDALRFPAEVASRYTNAMSFRVAGKIIERNMRLGDTVRAGQILARLDPSDAQQQATGAQAALDAAKHRLIFAQQQLDRDRAQSEQNLISALQLEQTQDAYTAALDAREQAAAQQAVAQNNLQYYTLRAEHDGFITSENADTGQVVAAGQAVYGLAWSGDTDVTIDAPEGRLGSIAVGQQAIVTFPALPNRRFEARVRELAPAADPQSRTYRVKLSLTPPDRDLRLGMTGEATLANAEGQGGSPAAGGNGNTMFVVPATAIFHQGAQPAVWVVRPKDSTLELRPVATSRYDATTATVTSGLQDGDQVVLAGVHTVFAGILSIRLLWGLDQCRPRLGASGRAAVLPVRRHTTRVSYEHRHCHHQCRRAPGNRGRQ
jgi:membrane fusion protein, multidrug efflux system